jgi:hypothetical protein
MDLFTVNTHARINNTENRLCSWTCSDFILAIFLTRGAKREGFGKIIIFFAILEPFTIDPNHKRYFKVAILVKKLYFKLI